MLRARVIPCLLLKGAGLVKTVRFSQSKYVGDPINAVRIFNEKEVDELVLLDIEASRERREPNYELIGHIASEAFMPVCYGGGIVSLDQARRLVTLGVEKVAINSAAFTDPQLVRELAATLGTQSVVVGIDVRKDWLGRYKVWNARDGKVLTANGDEQALAMEKLGAGEIFLNDVDRDGTREGFDETLIRQVSNRISIPLIACGGAGKLDDFRKAVNAGASAVAAGSLFVFVGKYRAVMINYPKYSDLERILGSVN